MGKRMKAKLPNSAFMARPGTFKIEMTKGCNLRCKFCPVFANEEFQGNYEYMTPDRLALIAPQIAELHDDCRIELTRRGEPTLNPYIAENIAVLRKHIPKAQISVFTNGTVFLKKGTPFIEELMDAGLNIFNIDCYNNTFDRFSQMVKKLSNQIKVADFREFSAYRRYSSGHKLKVITLVPDIADPAVLVRVRVIHNGGGNSDPVQLKKNWGVEFKEPLQKRCAKAVREMNINFDGTVPLCCDDWKGEYTLGKLPEQTVREVWYGDRHLAAARSLYNKDRSGTPCNKCSYHGGYRLGLLRNPFEAKV